MGREERSAPAPLPVAEGTGIRRARRGARLDGARFGRVRVGSGRGTRRGPRRSQPGACTPRRHGAAGQGKAGAGQRGTGRAGAEVVSVPVPEAARCLLGAAAGAVSAPSAFLDGSRLSGGRAAGARSGRRRRRGRGGGHAGDAGARDPGRDAASGAATVNVRTQEAIEVLLQYSVLCGGEMLRQVPGTPPLRQPVFRIFHHATRVPYLSSRFHHPLNRGRDAASGAGTPPTHHPPPPPQRLSAMVERFMLTRGP